MLLCFVWRGWWRRGAAQGAAHLERRHCARMNREINASLHRAINRDRATACTGTPSILNVQRRDAGANIFLSSLRCCQSCSHFYSSAQKNTRFSGFRYKNIQNRSSSKQPARPQWKSSDHSRLSSCSPLTHSQSLPLSHTRRSAVGPAVGRAQAIPLPCSASRDHTRAFSLSAPSRRRWAHRPWPDAS